MARCSLSSTTPALGNTPAPRKPPVGGGALRLCAPRLGSIRGRAQRRSCPAVSWWRERVGVRSPTKDAGDVGVLQLAHGERLGVQRLARLVRHAVRRHHLDGHAVALPPACEVGVGQARIGRALAADPNHKRQRPYAPPPPRGASQQRTLEDGAVPAAADHVLVPKLQVLPPDLEVGRLCGRARSEACTARAALPCGVRICRGVLQLLVQPRALLAPRPRTPGPPALAALTNALLAAPCSSSSDSCAPVSPSSPQKQPAQRWWAPPAVQTLL